MDVLVVDLTHGGVIIAVELSKLEYFNNVYAYDLYGTLKNEDKKKLLGHNIIIIKDIYELNDHSEAIENHDKDRANVRENEYINKNELLISCPIHSPLTTDEIREKINQPNGLNLTHHETVKLLLKQWKNKISEEKIAVIEVTGVKGKTTTVSLLKSILKNHNPLSLTSLGATLTLNNETITLKKNISITPANILETIKLADKINNDETNYSKCSIESPIRKDKLNSKNHDYRIAIFESSLGTSGVGDVGVLTNIVENYEIAKNTSNAKIAKEQVFNNEYVVIDYYTLTKFYPEKIKRSKMNSFTLNDYDLCDENVQPNLIANKINYNLKNSEIEIKYENIKTIYGNELNGELNIQTFALGEHHVLNILCAVTTALTLKIDLESIKEGLMNYKPVEGRSSIQLKDNVKIIEEINPGLNVKSIEKSIDSVKDLNNYSVILGGKYGVTCEEIDEISLSKLLDDLLNKYDLDLTLVDELGENISSKMENKTNFFEDYLEAQEIAIKKGKNILFIYRSNYSQINKR
ncbi:MAG: coenzyme F430 synthase [Methanobrevibacter sp.]|jgi:UDP-N-acetylmuramyl pentapeptide synthase|nr:coenzyme F430 synthase [Candidatus Methanovirga basalitermitum]